MKMFFCSLLLSAVSFAQVTASSGNVTLNADGQYAVNVFMTTKCFSGINTTLVGALDNVSTSFTLKSGTGLGNTSLVLIDGNTANAEVIQLGTKTGASVTGAARAIVPAAGCAAGAVCTAAIAHADGAPIQELCFKGNSAVTAQFVYNNFIKYLALQTLASIQNQVPSPTVAALLTQIAALQVQVAAANAASAQ